MFHKMETSAYPSHSYQWTTYRWKYKRTYFHPILQCLQLPAQGEKMKYAEDFTDAIIKCSWPSLATPAPVWCYRLGGQAQRSLRMACSAGRTLVILMSSKLFLEMGSCLKRQVLRHSQMEIMIFHWTQNQICLFFFLYRNSLCAMCLGSQKEIILWLPVPLC